MSTSTSAASAATHAASAQQPNAAQFLMQMANGFMISSAMYVVAKISIADMLAAGPQPVSTLAQKSQTNEDALYRILRALSSVGLFTELTNRTFALTAPAGLLRSGTPDSMRDLVLWMTNKLHHDVWSGMMHSAKTGQSAVEHLYKRPCFEVFQPHEEFTVEFNNAMTNISAGTVPAVLKAYDFSGIHKLVDIGGGHGFLICEILKAYPEMRGVLYDMAPVIADARPKIEAQGLSFRLESASGSFFESAPEGGDAYIMQHIIHDWNDAKCHTILSHVHRAMKPNGKLLVLDSVVQPGAQGDPSAWLDIEMLVFPGGRERTEQEFRELFAKAGFRLTRAIPTPGVVSIIEAVRA